MSQLSDPAPRFEIGSAFLGITLLTVYLVLFTVGSQVPGHDFIPPKVHTG
jgi:hypothetical protein